jgi:5-methylcytosine-specific restriction endonuclease McrA
MQRLWRCDVCPVRPMFQAGRCRRCDEFFVMLWNDQPCRYCSERCQKRDHSSTRRVRKRDAFVEPVYRARIFERDDWRCQICKRKVRRNAVVPHPNAPVLDHITPLADGGTHEPANVQCAHYLCNSIKSAGAANDQLRLIG